MVIDFGETEILEGQMPEAGDGIVRRKFSGADLIKQIADGLGVQSSS
jgi:hypothetical protein